MPVRAALNLVYAMAVEGRDEKDRKEFDARLYGWDAVNERANRDLMDRINESGGES